MKRMTAKQQRILEYIAEFTDKQGYPPSVRDICAGVGLSSPSTVHAHIKTLRALGYLEKDDHKTRALTLRGMGGPVTRVPIVGSVTAGLPILAAEQIEGYLPVELSNAYGQHFALHVTGESMIGAGILDGDLIIVRKQETAENGQIVVALLEDEATCKRLKRERGSVWLMPENPSFSPIDGTDCSLLGVVVAVYRQYPG